MILSINCIITSHRRPAQPKRRSRNRLFQALVIALWLPACAIATDDCRSGVAVQILGSGGPIPDDDRASAGYLIWIDGVARVLIDAGGGVFQRFAASGAKIEDLQHLAVTHFHADHSADVAALIKGGYFSPRRRPLTISGPAGGGQFPSLESFLQREFGKDTGAYAYLSGSLSGENGLFELIPRQVNPAVIESTIVSSSDAVTVKAIGVNHGPVPALAYIVEAGEFRIAFSGDQSGRNSPFWSEANGADLVLMDHAVPQSAGRVARNLHALPSEIGENVAAAGVSRLVLSHLMARSLTSLQANIALIRENYKGDIVIAEDLQCISLGATKQK